MVQIPAGVEGWSVFFTGLLIVAYRVHGIDSPREWIGWLEARFTDMRTLQFIGAVLIAMAASLIYHGDLAGWLFAFSVALLGIIGFGLLFATNHMRMLVLATAEADDKHIRIVSIVVTIIGMIWMLIPWF